MPSFTNPFSGNIQNLNSNEEIIRALELDIASELEAIVTYDAHIEATSNEDVKKVLKSIRDEEKVHVGELYTLINFISNDKGLLDIELYNKGVEEVYSLLEECLLLYRNNQLVEVQEKQIVYDTKGNKYETEKGDFLF